MNYDVFISYSTKDQQLSDLVCQYLEEKGLHCFIASRDIPKGAQWPSFIADALKNSRLLLAIFTQNYNLSIQVNKELTIAFKRHIPLLTFKSTEDDFEGTKDYFLSEVNYIKAYPNPEDALKPLYEDLSALLKINAPSGAGAQDQKLSFTYKEDREKVVKELIAQKPKNPLKRLELANQLLAYKEWQTAFYWYSKAAEKDIPEAVFHLADCYHRGLGTTADNQKALELFEKAFRLGVVRSANRLGHIYYSGGNGIDQDYSKSLEWFEKADSEDCPETAKDLADYYSEGKACPSDESKEFYYRKQYYDYHFYNALENEDVESMYILGVLCEEGKGVDQNDAYAKAWYDRAAKYGSYKARFRLGEVYEKGLLNVAEDEQKAFRYMEEASDYYEKAMVRLGDYYRLGIGTQKNPAKAFQCYLLAGETGDPESLFRIGDCYEKGIGTPMKPNKAESYYQRAADQGIAAARSALGILQCFKLKKQEEGLANLEIAIQDNDFSALNALGIVYAGRDSVEEKKKAIEYFLRASTANTTKGEPLTRIGDLLMKEGPMQNMKKSFEYYQKAATIGNLGAMRHLATCYIHGRGVEQDDFQAFYWASKAVEKGNERALNILGECYRFGIGTKRDPQKAIDCYKKYTEAGNSKMGAINIGEMHFSGEGVPVNYEEATKWLQRACDGRFAQPYVLIGRMYEIGAYGEKNISQAISWYNKGAQLGSPFADYYLGRCYANDEIFPDPEKAVSFFTKAAEAGLSEAKMELAKCYLEGLGIERDIQKAFAIFLEVTQKWQEMRQAIGTYITLAKVKGGSVTNERQCELKKPLYTEAMYLLGKCYLAGTGTKANESEGMRWIKIAAKLGNEDAKKAIESAFNNAD